MTTWFTSDTHFGHAAILGYCRRPFSSVEEMDQGLIQLWNAVVSRRDEVWHLGDFGYGPSDRMRSVFQRLNGKKRLIIGNHDGNAVLGLDWSAPPVHYAETKVDGVRIVLFTTACVCGTACSEAACTSMATATAGYLGQANRLMPESTAGTTAR
jgi:calcineurin-like phosphoesterase family protein